MLTYLQELSNIVSIALYDIFLSLLNNMIGMDMMTMTPITPTLLMINDKNIFAIIIIIKHRSNATIATNNPTPLARNNTISAF